MQNEQLKHDGSELRQDVLRLEGICDRYKKLNEDLKALEDSFKKEIADLHQSYKEKLQSMDRDHKQ